MYENNLLKKFSLGGVYTSVYGMCLVANTTILLHFARGIILAILMQKNRATIQNNYREGIIIIYNFLNFF